MAERVKPPVSKFSPVMIGLQENPNTNTYAKKVFEDEAKEISTYLQGIHHSRKISHQQVNYSDTVTKLGKFQRDIPVYNRKVDDDAAHQPGSFGNTERGFRLKEYNDKMSTFVAQEHDWNERKRVFNREAGRKAVVNEIMAGTAPLPAKPLLFPQKATHTQVLAIAGTLKSPDARIIPPRIERGKKWLGEGIGWES